MPSTRTLPSGPYFQVRAPIGKETPVVVEIPHAGVLLDPESLAYCVAPAASIGQDADLLVDELFEDAPQLGATSIVSGLSRYVVDLNRAEDDLDSHTTASGTSAGSPHGVIWRRTTRGRPALLAPLPKSEVERRLTHFYRPYHQALQDIIESKRRQFGFVILLCGHSMPSFGRMGERRADVVPGTRGRSTTAEGPLRCVEEVARSARLELVHDEPYRGGYTTLRYGRPNEGRHAIQIELARRLYMDEERLAKSVDFTRAREFCRLLVERLGQASPA